MYQDIGSYCKTCDVCLRTKRNFSFRTKPLNPLEPPSSPCTVYQIDFKTLPRKSSQGSVGILCIIDSYSGWPILRAVKDFSAETTARVFFNEVITKWGIPEVVISDRGASFCSRFFSCIVKMLGIKHRISSARSPRTNGMCESLVKRASDLLKVYAKDDSHLDDVLPLCEMCLRASNHSNIKLSPYEIHMGRKMWVGLPVELTDSAPKLSQDQQSYFDWLRHRLKDIHAVVDQNLAENKAQMKSAYDQRHNVVEPQWSVGDKVLILDKKVPVGSPSVLTYPQYHGPYYISDVVQRGSIGTAYRLINVDTGKVLKSLIAADRLKKYTVDDRSKISARLPGMAKDTQPKVTKPVVDKSLPDGFGPAVKILREKLVGNQKKYLVLFTDKSCWWSDAVSDSLLKEFRLRKVKNRRGRRR